MGEMTKICAIHRSFYVKIATLYVRFIVQPTYGSLILAFVWFNNILYNLRYRHLPKLMKIGIDKNFGLEKNFVRQVFFRQKFMLDKF